MLVEAVRLLANEVFNGRTVDAVVEERRKGTVFEVRAAAGQAVIYGPKVQKRLS